MQAIFQNGQTFSASEPTENLIFNKHSIGGWVATFSLYGVSSGKELEEALDKDNLLRIVFASEEGQTAVLSGYNTLISVKLFPVGERADIQLLKRRERMEQYGGDET